MSDAPAPTAEQALARLLEGNARFVRGEAHAHTPRQARLAELAAAQHPFATILGCSDSRVPPEWIFDAGLGELFVIRVAGNVLAPEVAGSLQYAGSHLRTPLMMVLGHEGCGALKAALATRIEGVAHLSRVQHLVDMLLPGLGGVDLTLPPAERLAQAVEQNVRATVRAIHASPEGRARADDATMRLVGAVYEIATGRVRVLDEAPGQASAR